LHLVPGQPEVLIKEESIRGRVAEMARRISKHYTEAAVAEVILVGVLRGAFIFLADLARLLTIPHRVDFIAVSAYGTQAGTTPGAVRLVKDLTIDISGKHVLVIEDIVDTGRTLRYLLDMLHARQPASLRTCALVRKPGKRAAERAQEKQEGKDATDIRVDFIGFEIADEWVVGYGLDYRDQWRTLPYIGTVRPD
jgi:hypoxanthine phosphoribosyltransferase